MSFATKRNRGRRGIFALGGAIELAVGVLGVLSAFFAFVPPIHQPAAYHAFADRRTLGGIPHALNVLSNAPFLIIGLWGLVATIVASDKACQTRAERWAFAIVFASLVAVAFGSSYYHWLPDNQRLFWDRLGIGLLLMALLGVTFMERVSMKIGVWLLPLLVLVGIGVTLVWKVTGDLRAYILAQALAIVGLPFLLAVRPPRYDRGQDLALVAVLYILAKGAEALDAPIWALTHTISGHTLKHLLAAAATAMLLFHLSRRRICTRDS